MHVSAILTITKPANRRNKERISTGEKAIANSPTTSGLNEASAHVHHEIATLISMNEAERIAATTMNGKSSAENSSTDRNDKIHCSTTAAPETKKAALLPSRGHQWSLRPRGRGRFLVDDPIFNHSMSHMIFNR